MKFQPLLSLLAAFALPVAVSAAPIPSDQFTTFGKTLFTEEINHGPQVYQTSAFSAAVTTDSEGHIYSLTSLMGSPGKLAINNALTGENIKTLPLGKNAAGSYATLPHSSGDIYLSSHPHGHLFRYRQGADELEDLGKAPGVKFIWELEEIGTGKIILACYPESKIIEFDPATGAYTDMGPAAEGDDYARAVAWHAPTNMLYVGVGSRPKLIQWNLATNEKKDILPDVGDESTMYNVDVVGDYLVTRVSPSKKGLVFDLKTLEVYDRLPLMDGNAISKLAPDNNSYFFTNGGDLMQHNLETREAKKVADIAGNTRGMNFPVIDGTPHLATISYGGTIDLITLETSETKTVKQKLPKEPVDIHSLFLGPDARTYSSGYVAGSLGIFDPATSEHVQIGDVAQTEDADYGGNVFLFGTYPRARITRYQVDPAKISNVSEDNPKELFRMEGIHQDRPYAIHSMPGTNSFAIGTIPTYGKLGGAVALYNDDTGSTRLLENIAGKRGVVSFANTSSTLYIGTTISGGLGVEAEEKEAVLVGVNLESGEKLFEQVIVPSAHIISGLKQMPDGKIWGWANATLFIFDPETNEVEHKEVVQEMGPRSGHLWRGAKFTHLKDDGTCYAIVYGQVLHINIAERAIQKVADAKGFSMLVYHEPTDSLFFARKHELFQWK